MASCSMSYELVLHGHWVRHLTMFMFYGLLDIQRVPLRPVFCQYDATDNRMSFATRACRCAHLLLDNFIEWCDTI